MKKFLIILMASFNGSALFSATDAQEWTHAYRKHFSAAEQQQYAQQALCIFERLQVPPFSQLIFSWNAVRPMQGAVTFWAQVKDNASQQWGPWHRMMSWGHDVQRSYEEVKKAGLISSYHYVRLEVDKSSQADAFRIKVEAEDGASLACLRSFVVSVTDFEAFVPEKTQELASLPSSMVKGVPAFSQFQLDHAHADRLCSPTSCSMVASFLGKKKVLPTLFAQGVYDEGLGVYGSWSFNTAQLFEVLGGTVSASVVRMNSFKQLHAQLVKGLPVIVSVRGALHGAPKTYDNGHLLVVVGWNAQRHEVICNDPAQKTDAEVRVAYSIRDFIAAWERSRRLTYLIETDRAA